MESLARSQKCEGGMLIKCLHCPSFYPSVAPHCSLLATNIENASDQETWLMD